MQHDYPRQVGWNEWTSVIDNTGGSSMQRTPHLYRPFQNDLEQWSNQSIGGMYQQWDPNANKYTLEMKRWVQGIQGLGQVFSEEERNLLYRIHERGRFYKLRLLEEVGVCLG
jgi:hypothetical protein